MWSISATIFSCVFCLLSLWLHTLPLFHLECVYQNIFVCNNRLKSSYPFSSNLLSIWECSNPQMLSESNQRTICSNSSRACDQNIPWFDVDPCIGCGTVPVFSLFTSQFHQVHFWLSILLWLTCHLLFLYHTPYYQKSRTLIIFDWSQLWWFSDSCLSANRKYHKPM